MAAQAQLSPGCHGLLPFSQPLSPQKPLQDHGSAKTCTSEVWLEKCWCCDKAKGKNKVMQKAGKPKQQLYGSDGLVPCANTSTRVAVRGVQLSCKLIFQYFVGLNFCQVSCLTCVKGRER